MKKTIILSLILLSFVSQAAEARDSISCVTQIMTAAKSGIETKEIDLAVKLDRNGFGEASVKTVAYNATIVIQGDSDLKNMHYMIAEIQDTTNSNDTYDITLFYGLMVPIRLTPNAEPTLTLMTELYRDNNSTEGIVLFTPSVQSKFYEINKNYTNTIEKLKGLHKRKGYDDVVMKAVEAGTIKVGDALGLIVHGACK